MKSRILMLLVFLIGMTFIGCSGEDDKSTSETVNHPPAAEEPSEHKTASSAPKPKLPQVRLQRTPIAVNADPLTSPADFLLAIARQCSNTDEKANLLIHAARGFREQKRSQAVSLLHEARALVETANDPDNAKDMELKAGGTIFARLSTIAVELADAGAKDEARKILEQLGSTPRPANEKYQDSRSYWVVNAWADIGEPERALTMVRSMNPKTHPDSLLVQIASTLIVRKDLENAQRVVDELKKLIQQEQSEGKRASGVMYIPALLVNLGQTEQAIDYAKTIKNSYFKTEALAGLVSHLARMGQFDEALELKSLVEDVRQPESFTNMAVIFLMYAEKARAAELAKEAFEKTVASKVGPSDTSRVSFLQTNISTLIDAGEVEEAKRRLPVAEEFARDLEERWRYRLLGGIAALHAKAGNKPKSLQLLKEATDASASPSDKKHLRLRVADAFAEVGDVDETARLLKEFENLPREPYQVNQEANLSRAGGILLKIGKTEQAISLGKLAGDEKKPTRYLVRLASELALEKLTRIKVFPYGSSDFSKVKKTFTETEKKQAGELLAAMKRF